MAEKTYWESVKAEGDAVLDRIRELVREGNVRRVIVQHDGHTIAEFPLTVGVVGSVLAPALAGIAAVIALVKDCTIRVERSTPDVTHSEPPRAEKSA